MGTRRSARVWKSQADTPLISLKRVSRFYKPEKPSLFDVSFDVWAGEFVYIAGPSGAGKSTLMRLLRLSESPDTGSVLFFGHDVTQLKKSALAMLRRSMGIVFQDFRLIGDLSARSNVGLPLEIAGFSKSIIEKKADEILEKVGLPGMGNELAQTLSGGEQQRVALARALAANPSVILADEPTGSLDTYSANFVLDLFEEVNAGGTTVILATHDRMLMSARPHRVVAFESGRMVGMSSKRSAGTENRGAVLASS